MTVSHEDDDVIMAESGLNLAELDTQDDRELIHMVLEDANFEQELEGEPSGAVATSSPNELRDSGFYSDGRSAGEASPSPTEDHALEAWLADPEHVNLFLDSTLLATLEMESSPQGAKTSTSTGSPDVGYHVGGGRYPRVSVSSSPPKTHLRRQQLSYTQWRKFRLRSRAKIVES